MAKKAKWINFFASFFAILSFSFRFPSKNKSKSLNMNSNFLKNLLHFSNSTEDVDSSVKLQNLWKDPLILFQSFLCKNFLWKETYFPLFLSNQIKLKPKREEI